MMELVPPVGWADVATKRDLEVLERVLRLEIERTRSDLLAGMERGLRNQSRFMLLANSGTLLAIVGLLLGTGRLA
jgi:hypothetical protein